MSVPNTLLTASLQGAQISHGQLWTLGVTVQRIVNVCVDYSCPQTHHRGCASFGISSLLCLDKVKSTYEYQINCHTNLNTYAHLYRILCILVYRSTVHMHYHIQGVLFTTYMRCMSGYN